MKRALISVADKTDVVNLASYLNEQHVEIISTGGTAKILQQHNIPVIEISSITNFPEILHGRVKTLNPNIYGGILAKRNNEDKATIESLGISFIDLVVVNLYPFEQTIANENHTFADAIENIDIGGPALLRASAKNHQWVTVICDPNDYTLITNQELNDKKQKELACKAFSHTANYDQAIAHYLHNNEKNNENDLPNTFSLPLKKTQTLRYGENPHQGAALYQTSKQKNTPSLANANQVQGKELSYNNYADANAAINCLNSFSQEPTCVIVKHANPCGIASAESIEEAYETAFEADSLSAFGGIIALNRRLTTATAQAIIDNQFAEVIIAPSIQPEAKTVFAQKPNIRVLIIDKLDQYADHIDVKSIQGGFLVQQADTLQVTTKDIKLVTNHTMEQLPLDDLLFAWNAVKHVKSNAIVIAQNKQTLGIGAGQMSRVMSVDIAIEKSDKNKIKNAVLASDAFFPFVDSIEKAAQAGIKAIIQPGGSMHDKIVIAKANELNIPMVFTGVRHFFH